MCIKPIKIYNNSHTINKNSFQKMIYYVPCGKCCECELQKQNEFQIRNYWQCVETLENKGFIVFDTLTYDNNNLPSARKELKDYVEIPANKDFSCFRKSDFVKFFKLLKTRISRQGYDAKKIKYFLASEYGTDNRFTHRPHYHILFFVSDNKISPYYFSLLVSELWKYGRTDGIKYQGVEYFQQKRLFTELNNNVIKACEYVSKYVTKDSDFEKIIESRKKYITSLFTFDKKSIQNSYSGRLIIRHIMQPINQFHLQSQGHGIRFIKSFNYDTYVYNSYKIDIQRSCKIGEKCNMPSYYRRKLFQYQNDKKEWKYNELGQREYKERINIIESNLNKLLNNWYNNLNSDQKNDVDYLLDGRKLSDYTNYMINYKDRIQLDDEYNNFLIYNYLSSKNKTKTELPKPSEVHEKRFDNGKKCDILYFYNTASDNDKYCMRFTTMNFNPIDICKHKHIILTKTFVFHNTINSRRYYQFRKFDELFNYFVKSNKQQSEIRQKEYNEEKRLRRLYKAVNQSN